MSPALISLCMSAEEDTVNSELRSCPVAKARAATAPARSAAGTGLQSMTAEHREVSWEQKQLPHDRVYDHH